MLLVYMPYSSPRMSLGGWWGKRSSLGKSHSCQGTSATFSLLNRMVAVSSFLDVRLRDVHMSPCLLEFGIWNTENMVSVPETFLSDTPWSSLSCIAPRGLRNISPLLPYATLSISASNQGEVYTVILQRKKLKWCMCTCGIYTQRYLGFLPHLL